MRRPMAYSVPSLTKHPGRRCQTNANRPQFTSYGNRSGRAVVAPPEPRVAARVSLKLVRLCRWRLALKWLRTDEWTATNFCKVRMRLNRSIARSRHRNDGRKPLARLFTPSASGAAIGASPWTRASTRRVASASRVHSVPAPSPAASDVLQPGYRPALTPGPPHDGRHCG